MTIHKCLWAATLLSLSGMALCGDWYGWHQIPGALASDKNAEYSFAKKRFQTDQPALQANGSMKPGDTVTMQYADGAIATFMMGKLATCAGGRCAWGDDPFEHDDPKVQQGPKHSQGKEARQIGLTPGITLPPMAVYPIATSTVYQPVIDAYPGAIPVIFSPGDFGGGAAGGGFPPGGACPRGLKCPPVMEH